MHGECNGRVIFPVLQFMRENGWVFIAQLGKMKWEGVYQKGATTLTITITPGLGDVVVRINGRMVRAESKGGPIIKKNKGNPERSIICRLIGQLMLSKPQESGEVMLAAVPATQRFRNMIAKCTVFPRLMGTGLRFLLVARDGTIEGLNGIA